MDLVRAGYDALGSRYRDWAAAGTGDPRADWLDQVVAGLQAGSRVLDLGCGPGVPTTAWLAGRFEVTGVDLSERQIDLARGAVPNARFILSDMAAVDFAEGSFDAVVALYSLIHLPRSALPAMLDKIRSWLVPSGSFLATLGTQGTEEVEGDWLGVPMFFAGLTPIENRALVSDAGFEILADEVVTILEEGEGEVRFHWVLARAPGPTRAAIRAIHHIQLAMPPGGENEAEAFYAGLLGIPRVAKPTNLEVRGGCWFRSDTVEIHLGVEQPFTPAHKAHPAFLVEDLAALRLRLIGASTEVTVDEPLAGYERFYASDPFGNRLEFLGTMT